MAGALATRAARSSSVPAGRARPPLFQHKKVSRVFLFWAAFILTRPLGATVGDWFDKPVAKGGLDMTRADRLGRPCWS